MSIGLNTTVAAAITLTFAAATPAFAHAHLTGEVPAENASGPAPKELHLKFSEGIELKFTGVKITGPAKAAVATGDATLDPADEAALVVPLPGTLAAGKYTVNWHALSTDGHKTHGAYSFTVTP